MSDEPRDLYLPPLRSVQTLMLRRQRPSQLRRLNINGTLYGVLRLSPQRHCRQVVLIDLADADRITVTATADGRHGCTCDTFRTGACGEGRPCLHIAALANHGLLGDDAPVVADLVAADPGAGFLSPPPALTPELVLADE